MDLRYDALRRDTTLHYVLRALISRTTERYELRVVINRPASNEKPVNDLL